MDYELKFDPRTIEHLGVKMYSTLPPALAELISNAYDADASEIEVLFHEQSGSPVSITVKDNGSGMTAEDIQGNFLVIGRNRRLTDGDKPSPVYKRLPTGKKGLGKLALFGLAKNITVDTIKENNRNRFVLDWDTLLGSDGVYNPKTEIVDEDANKKDNGTAIILRDLKRKSAFGLDKIAESLSRIFIVDDNFKITLKKTDGEIVEVTNELRYEQLDQEFLWDKNNIDCDVYKYLDDLEFNLITGKTPIKPNSGLRGITIFSRGKLVNSPEFFSSSTSSHFYQYLTGWIKADFIDLIEEDVISTNRQSIDWDNEEMQEFREWLSDLIAKVSVSWREERKNKKDKEFIDRTGIDKDTWFEKLPEDIKNSAEIIIKTLSDDEGVDESFSPVMKALHEIIPEYPRLHWRHLHPEIQEASKEGYESKNYYSAVLEAIKRYANRTREYSGHLGGMDLNLMGEVFGPEEGKLIKVADGFKRANGTSFSVSTIENIEKAQRKLSQGVIEGCRNVVAHEEILDLHQSGLFSEIDCLDLLSIISHLMYRIDEAQKKKTA